MKKVSALIFDLDGTLIDSSADITRCLNVVLKSYGFGERKEEEVQGFIGDGIRILLEKACGSQDAELLSKMEKSLKSYYSEHCIETTHLYPGVAETLKHFREKKMALISNKPYEMVIKTLEHFSVRDYLKVVLGAESTANRKPHPEPILKAVEILKAKPLETLVVGDGTTDILAGKSAGTWTCAVTYGYRSAEELQAAGPDFVISRIEELKEIIN